MPQTLDAHLLPALTTPDELAGGTVVVIDVLRATTTITYALAAGCQEVIPCLEVADALVAAARLPLGQAVLGGERDGLRIAGFDLGNSPAEYTPSAVAGKTVVFTTTNGTRAMQICRQAHRALIGAFINLSAVCEAAGKADRVHLLCAGTQGRVTREDVLLAGAIAARLLRMDPAAWSLNDEARLALDAWAVAAVNVNRPDGSRGSAALADELRDSHGGRHLLAIGLERDLVDVAWIDRVGLVGELRLDRWSISPGCL